MSSNFGSFRSDTNIFEIFENLTWILSDLGLESRCATSKISENRLNHYGTFLIVTGHPGSCFRSFQAFRTVLSLFKIL